jgi:hypothetical protein
MRSASCGFENPDGLESLQPSSPIFTTSLLPTRAQAFSSHIVSYLAAKLLTSPRALAGQRQQLTMDRGIMKERE